VAYDGVRANLLGPAPSGPCTKEVPFFANPATAIQFVAYIAWRAGHSMRYEQRYKKAKKRLLEDPAICDENKALFARFFEYQEYKLKRINNLPIMDESTRGSNISNTVGRSSTPLSSGGTLSATRSFRSDRVVAHRCG
jgi:hypothetical protein